MPNVKDYAWGLGRLNARLDIADSQYFPAVTVPQADAIRQQFIATRIVQNDILLRTKQVLSSEGVSSALFGAYCAFSMKALAIKLAYSGEAAALEFQTQIALWVARGLSQTVLEIIRTDVFNVAAPVAP
jgi:hypothetical protein